MLNFRGVFYLCTNCWRLFRKWSLTSRVGKTFSTTWLAQDCAGQEVGGRVAPAGCGFVQATFQDEETWIQRGCCVDLGVSQNACHP